MSKTKLPCAPTLQCDRSLFFSISTPRFCFIFSVSTNENFLKFSPRVLNVPCNDYTREIRTLIDCIFVVDCCCFLCLAFICFLSHMLNFVIQSLITNVYYFGCSSVLDIFFNTQRHGVLRWFRKGNVVGTLIGLRVMFYSNFIFFGCLDW